jgi:hypothetical protein
VPDGYIALQSDTYQGFALLRSNVKSNSVDDVAAAVDHGRRIRFYPLVPCLWPAARIFRRALGTPLYQEGSLIEEGIGDH